MLTFDNPETSLRKKRAKKKAVTTRILICGVNDWLSAPKNHKAIKKALKEFDYHDVDCIILSTSLFDKQLHAILNTTRFNLLIVPKNMKRFEYNAYSYRNDWIWRNLKPTHVLVCAPATSKKEDDKKLSEDSKSCLQHIKYSRAKKIEYERIK